MRVVLFYARVLFDFLFVSLFVCVCVFVFFFYHYFVYVFIHSKQFTNNGSIKINENFTKHLNFTGEQIDRKNYIIVHGFAFFVCLLVSFLCFFRVLLWFIIFLFVQNFT